jgi:uncharacterized protein YkwD
MKKLLLVITLFVSVFSLGQNDSIWVSKYPPLEEFQKETFNKDSVWWANYKMDTTKFRMAIMNEINKERKKVGKKPVTYGTVAQTNANQLYVNYQSEKHIVGHDSRLWAEDVRGEVSAGNSITVRYFIVDGEKIYEEVAKLLVGQWMKSPGHRSALLRDNWETISVGICFRYGGTRTRNSLRINSSVRGH